jgi:Holliday junction DNA helicase RuvB
MEINLPRFTFVGATTRVAMVSSPLRSRFGATFQLNFYEQQDIEKIIKRSSELLGIQTDPEAVKIIAKCSRFTPRVANRLLKRSRDFAQVEGKGIITEEMAKRALSFLEIDELGLESGDRKILEAIIKKFGGGPVGIQALSAATSEEEETVLDIYEPYLMQLGFIERTPRGRVATKIAHQHLGMKYKGNQSLI